MSTAMLTARVGIAVVIRRKKACSHDSVSSKSASALDRVLRRERLPRLPCLHHRSFA